MAKSADAFRTISEVADWLDTPAHVLRFWESKFSQVKPVKRAGGRRYYRPADMLLLGGIKKLLHDDGVTIKGVQKILREQGVKYVSGFSQSLDGETEGATIDIALEVPLQAAPAATVVSFQRDTHEQETTVDSADTSDAPAEVEPQPEDVALSDTEDTDNYLDVDRDEATKPEPSELDETLDNIFSRLDAADPEKSSSDTSEDEPETKATETPDESRAVDAELQPPAEVQATPADIDRADEAANTPEAEEQAGQDLEPAVAEDEPPRPAPLQIDIPDDPTDSVDAPAGILTAMAALKRPISKDHARRLRQIAGRLRDVDNGKDTHLGD
ncbi:MerR family regulatory protein [Roseovarius litorisediminis]|uniref:MerR family regulatory protein n=1 Tax=Roseovarius litorisediminis TaxID=1312363 RepID=A0A1Y5RCM0_9RHOB|nr:MerR family transcriptional regulator [Roseovarius litorisediminis]SLN13088.1 MerR family regulatory protein [Roseovarius litorisediminis]